MAKPFELFLGRTKRVNAPIPGGCEIGRSNHLKIFSPCWHILTSLVAIRQTVWTRVEDTWTGDNVLVYSFEQHACLMSKSQKDRRTRRHLANKIKTRMNYVCTRLFVVPYVIKNSAVVVVAVDVIISVQWDHYSDDGNYASELLPAAVYLARDASAVRWTHWHRQVCNHQQLPHPAA